MPGGQARVESPPTHPLPPGHSEKTGATAELTGGKERATFPFQVRGEKSPRLLSWTQTEACKGSEGPGFESLPPC